MILEQIKQRLKSAYLNGVLLLPPSFEISPSSDDEQNLRNDWEKIGNDFRQAVKKATAK